MYQLVLRNSIGRVMYAIGTPEELARILLKPGIEVVGGFTYEWLP